MDKNALSYWFPRLEAAGLPVPRTRIVPMPAAAQEDIFDIFDGNDRSSGGMVEFAKVLANEASAIGFPIFLRTDHTSGKHNWDRTCFVRRPEDLAAHVCAIAEFSECAGPIGLPWDVWVVREMLETIPLGVCPRYGNMPVCREFRFFVEDDAVRCWHPYWPSDALEKGGASHVDYAFLCAMPDGPELFDLASRAGKAVGGAWSVDILETRSGWFVTDMALASDSYHWPVCPMAGRK